jgi:hypothetical protein
MLSKKAINDLESSFLGLRVAIKDFGGAFDGILYLQEQGLSPIGTIARMLQDIEYMEIDLKDAKEILTLYKDEWNR